MATTRAGVELALLRDHVGVLHDADDVVDPHLGVDLGLLTLTLGRILGAAWCAVARWTAWKPDPMRLRLSRMPCASAMLAGVASTRQRARLATDRALLTLPSCPMKQIDPLADVPWVWHYLA